MRLLVTHDHQGSVLMPNSLLDWALFYAGFWASPSYRVVVRMASALLDAEKYQDVLKIDAATRSRASPANGFASPFKAWRYWHCRSIG